MEAIFASVSAGCCPYTTKWIDRNVINNLNRPYA